MSTPEQFVMCKSYDESIDEKFCFVSLGSFKYEVVLDGLRYFYPRMVTGGIIALVEYDFPGLPHTKDACDAFEAELGAPLQKVMYGDYTSLSIVKY
jgi:hypothetical protein